MKYSMHSLVYGEQWQGVECRDVIEIPVLYYVYVYNVHSIVITHGILLR